MGNYGFEMGTYGPMINDDYMAHFEAMTTTNTSGAVPTTYRVDKFINAIFQESHILPLCSKYPGLKGVVDIPREGTGIKAYWVKEADTTPESKMGMDKITLVPKTAKAKVRVTRQMLNMSALQLESMIIAHMKREIKALLEKDLLYGEGSDDSPITGIFNTSGVQTINDYFSAPDYAKTADFQAKLSAIGYNPDNLAFIANAGTQRLLKTSLYTDKSRTDRYLMNEKGDFLCGYKFVLSGHVSDNHIVFGDFSDVVIGMWSTLQVQALKNDEGDVVFTGFFDVDVALKDPKRMVIAKS